MSHPNLGSYSNARTVDLATCTRTVTHDAEPDGQQMPLPGGKPSGEHTRTSEAVLPERCAEIAKLLAAITVADAVAGREAAKIDTEACVLDVSCPQDGPSKLSVQRQTTSGTSAVERLLKAL